MVDSWRECTQAIRQLSSMWSRIDADATKAWIDSLSTPDQSAAEKGVSSDVREPAVILIGGDE